MVENSNKMEIKEMYLPLTQKWISVGIVEQNKTFARVYYLDKGRPVERAVDIRRLREIEQRI